MGGGAGLGISGSVGFGVDSSTFLRSKQFLFQSDDISLQAFYLSQM